MLRNKRITAFALTFTVFSIIQSQEIDRKQVFAAQKLGEVSIVHDNGDFMVKDLSGLKLIPRCFVDQSIRHIEKDKLDKILGCGAYLYLNKMSNDSEYSLRLHGRLNGGGPITAKIAYWATMGIGYGLYVVGTWYDHELPAHHPEITQTIEAAASTAECAGLAAPTP